MENFPLSFAQRGFAGRVQPGGLKRGIDIRQSESRNSGDAMRNSCWTFLLVIVFRDPSISSCRRPSLATSLVGNQKASSPQIDAGQCDLTY